MKTVVCIKQTIDTEAVIELDDNGQVIEEGQTLAIDPYSEFAVEKAVQIKEAQGGEVIILTIGGSEALPAVRHALSMGADEGYIVDDPATAGSDSGGKARILAAAVKRLDAPLIMGGCKSADTSNAQVMPRVATILDVAQVNVVTALEVEGETLRATREIDDGVEIIEVHLPVVITAQQGLAEPRYPNVRDIMQSKKKPITNWTLADIGVEAGSVGSAAAKLIPVAFRLKPERSGGRIIEGEVPRAISETVDLLAHEAKVI